MHPKIEEAYKVGLLQVPEEIEYLCEFVEWKKPKNILEIGSCFGGSMMLWCHFAKPELAISLDIGTSHFGSDKVDYKKRGKMFEELGVKSIIADSTSEEAYNKVSELLGDRKLDMLFIDADHSFIGVLQDYLLYKNFLSNDGFILFHDIVKSDFHAKADCKVPEVWENLKGKVKINVIGKSNQGSGGFGILIP